LTRIAIIIPRIDHLGPVMVIKALTDVLFESNHLQIVLFYLDKKIDSEVKFKVPVCRLISSKFPFNDFDVIHTNGIRPDLFAYINRKKIRYHISTIHSFVFEDLKFAYNKVISMIFGNLWLIFLSKADKLVCVSNSLKLYYQTSFPSSKLEVIYNGIPENQGCCAQDDVIRMAADDFHSRGFTVVGSSCILSYVKGMDCILPFIAENESYALIVIGSGKELENLIRLAAKLKITSRCLFSGFRRNAKYYFRYFDVFIVPSRSEGFCLSLVEAIQQEIPVICSDLDVFREMFSRNEVMFFNLSDKSSLELAFQQIKILGKSNSEMAFSTYRSKFTNTIMARKYFELYQSA
jgi:L-malate glycosyltransferase